MEDKKFFLEEQRSEIIQNTRNPIQLADKLLEKKCINEEMYSNINSQSTNQNKTREIFNCIKVKKHFACAYDWLKKNEPELIKELKKSNAEAAEPPKKPARLENGDEADNDVTGFPDLRTISTFAKLEDWVSKPENSQKLISDFEGKLGAEGMETLEKELKDKEPKKSLCFSALNIDDIRKNKELGTFLSATKSKIIPKLTYMFFKKPGSASSGSTAQSSNDQDDFMDVTVHSDSSGYASLLRLNNSFSQFSLDNLQQNDKRLPDEDFPMDTQDKHIDEICEEPQRSKVKTHEDESTEVTHGSMNMQDTHIDEINEEPQTSPHQNESIIKNQTPIEDRGHNISMQQHKASKAPKKRDHLKSQREKKKKEKDELLRDWAVKQCNGTEEELKSVFDQISIINLAEHSSYPCYTAENVMVYKPLTPNSQIIYIADNNTSINTMTMAHYHMFVCGIKEAVILGPKQPKEKVIKCNESDLPLDKCENFIFKAFAPALAVYKKIQREESLYSLIQL